MGRLQKADGVRTARLRDRFFLCRSSGPSAKLCSSLSWVATDRHRTQASAALGAGIYCTTVRQDYGVVYSVDLRSSLDAAPSSTASRSAVVSNCAAHRRRKQHSSSRNRLETIGTAPNKTNRTPESSPTAGR
jgi:hypothetical protein